MTRKLLGMILLAAIAAASARADTTVLKAGERVPSMEEQWVTRQCDGTTYADTVRQLQQRKPEAEADALIREKKWTLVSIHNGWGSRTPGASCNAYTGAYEGINTGHFFKGACEVIVNNLINDRARRFNARMVQAMRASGDGSCSSRNVLGSTDDRPRMALAAAVTPCDRTQRQTDLPAAARAGCLAEVKRLLAAGADRGWRDAENLDALGWAILRRDPAMAATLLEAGLSPDRTSKQDLPLLALAIEMGSTDIVKLMLAHKADVNVQWGPTLIPTPSTPLDLAARRGDIETARILIAAGAKIEAEDGREEGPLTWAARGGNTDLIRLLLKLGADPNRRPTEAGTTKGTPLRGAITGRSVAAVKAMLAGGADPNLAFNSIQERPLHTATGVWANYEIAKTLIDAGAAADVPNRLERTPLHNVLELWELKPEQTQIVKLLLSKGADVNRPTNHGDTPLMLAARKCPPTPAFIKLFVDAGADRKARDRKGLTALERFNAKSFCPKDTQGSEADRQAVAKLLAP
jgi:ankyrin repeat protein